MSLNTKIVFLCVGCIILYFVARNLIASRVVLPLGEFMASSTQSIASSSPSSVFDRLQFSLIQAPEGDIRVAIADTDTLRVQGLSGVVSLPRSSGMLFTFPISGIYGLWMKDMNFPLDMVWIDSTKKVVGIHEHITPETFPMSFYPTEPVKYVLEINAYEAKKFGIATGTTLSF